MGCVWACICVEGLEAISQSPLPWVYLLHPLYCRRRRYYPGELYQAPGIEHSVSQPSHSPHCRGGCFYIHCTAGAVDATPEIIAKCLPGRSFPSHIEFACCVVVTLNLSRTVRRQSCYSVTSDSFAVFRNRYILSVEVCCFCSPIISNL